MRRKRVYGEGSISHGTMRPEDLIPYFCYELRYLAEANRDKDGTLRFCQKVERLISQDTGYFESDNAQYDLEELFERLNAYALPYHYFGAHPGDGSDYGFWLSEFFESDFDGLQVTDLSEVPKAYRGEILLVNDHGNISLYCQNSRGLKEIWAYV